jgi:6-pyruvoyltetrahydropterin/6-carboxytetrahydropterin synthase
VTTQGDSPTDGADVLRHVSVEGVRLRFAAAHMATLGSELEPLHGHNYVVRCRVEGALTADRWVIDFSLLKAYVREACEAIDHKFLLQARSTLLEATEAEGAWTVRFGDRSYRFPSTDVVALPIENTTAELLAEWIAGRVEAALGRGDHGNITRIAVDVQEMPGQAGGFVRTLG